MTFHGATARETRGRRTWPPEKRAQMVAAAAEEVRALVESKRLLFPFPLRIDPSLPAGTLEIVSGDQRIRIVDADLER